MNLKMKTYQSSTKFLLFNILSIFLLLKFHSCTNELTEKPRCNYVFYLEKPIDGHDCLVESICNKTFEVSYVRLYEAYHYMRYRIIQQTLARCCGKCAKIINFKNVTNYTEIEPASISSPHFTFPVLAPRDAKTMYGYYFIPVMNVPGVIYVTRKELPDVYRPIFELYPLFIICLLMAIMSGFFVWLFESRKNKEEFPREFFIGWFEGIWFSIVTMTTVGYGDSSPKSFTGKLFGIIWIFTGIVLTGLMAATLTTGILEANTPPPPAMKGKRIGMIKHSDYEGYVIARHEGRKVEIDEPDLLSNTHQLIYQLHQNLIDGFLLDKVTFYYISNRISQKFKDENFLRKYGREMIFFMHHTKRTEKRYNGPNICYGILVKQRNHYDYFSPLFIDNSFVIERSSEEAWLSHLKNESLVARGSFYSPSTMLFSPNEKYFQRTIVITVSIISLMFLFGFLYEVVRIRRLDSRKFMVQKEPDSR